MSSPVVVRSPQEFLAALKTMSTTAIPAVAQPEPSFAPLSLDQVNEKIAEFSLALESPLPDPVRAEIERRRVLLVTEQFRLTHGYIPDADGNNPAEVKAIVDAATAAATRSVIVTLAGAPAESTELELGPEDEEQENEEDEDGEEFDLDEQVEVLNEIDEADAVVVSQAEQTPAPLPVFQSATEGILLSPEAVMAFRASVAANLPHVTAKLVTMFLGK